ncbi:MAG: helix-turn-helix domain-containing protein [Bacteroidota bacterium]
MSYIGKNIKKIRTVKKLSQAQFAEIFSLARPSVGAYEEARAEPKVDTIIQIANYFGLSVDVLLNKELSVNDLYSFNLFNQKLTQAHEQLMPLKKAPVKSGGIGLVQIKNYLEYIVNYQNRDFISNLPSIDLPVIFRGNARAFELNGSEMEYYQNGLHHGDFLLCSKSDLTKVNKIREGGVYVIISDERIIARRVKSVDKKTLILSSDDPNYSLLEIPLKSILELWEVKGAYSTYLNPPKTIDEKVLVLEKQLRELSEKVSQLASKK